MSPGSIPDREELTVFSGEMDLRSQKIYRSASMPLFSFGYLQQESSSTFPDSAYYINFRQDNNIDVGGFYFDYGIQYTAKLKDVKMTAGAVFGTSTKVAAKTDYLYTTYLTSNGTDYPKDTIQSRAGHPRQYNDTHDVRLWPLI